MITYKGFNGDMTCRGFAFREGERSEESEAQAGRCGFHSAVNPLDVLTYYPDPLKAVYYVCEASGDISEDGSDSKVSSTELTPISRLSFEELIWHALWYMAAHPNAPLSSRVMRNRAMCTSLAVVRGKAPCGAVSEIGGVIGLAEEDKAGRVRAWRVLVCDGEAVKPGVVYNMKGVPADE